MSEAGEINKVLEKLGSDYRAFHGSILSHALVAVIEAIPAFIDKEIDDRLNKKAKTNGSA